MSQKVVFIEIVGLEDVLYCSLSIRELPTISDFKKKLKEFLNS